MKRVMIVSALLILFAVLAWPALAQEEGSTPVPSPETTANCLPEGAPTGYDYAPIHVQVAGVIDPSDQYGYSNYYYYRVDSTIKAGDVCAVSGWIARENYQNDEADFNDAASFQMLVSEGQAILSLSSGHFMGQFVNSDIGMAVTYMLEPADNGWKIVQINLSRSHLKVLDPDVVLVFESVIDD